MPKCISHTVHILIGCSEDVDDEIKQLSEAALDKLSESFSSDSQVMLIENLEKKLHDIVSTMPRIFNRKGR